MIHNHEVRSSILRPATRKRHHRDSVMFFVCPDTSPSRTKSVDHESLLSMGYGRGRNAARHWHTKNICKFSTNSPPAFLGNRHLRSKHGFIRRCEAPTGASCDPLQESDITESSVMFFVCQGASPSRTKSVDHENGSPSFPFGNDITLCPGVCGSEGRDATGGGTCNNR